MAEFLVVNVLGAYNSIVGRPFIHDVQGVVYISLQSNNVVRVHPRHDIKVKNKSRNNKIMLRDCSEVASKEDPYRRSKFPNVEGNESKEEINDGRRQF